METPMDYEMGYAQGYDEGRQQGNAEAWQDFAVELDELKKRNEALEKRIQDAFTTLYDIEEFARRAITILYQIRG